MTEQEYIDLSALNGLRVTLTALGDCFLPDDKLWKARLVGTLYAKIVELEKTVEQHMEGNDEL